MMLLAMPLPTGRAKAPWSGFEKISSREFSLGPAPRMAGCGKEGAWLPGQSLTGIFPNLRLLDECMIAFALYVYGLYLVFPV